MATAPAPKPCYVSFDRASQDYHTTSRVDQLLVRGSKDYSQLPALSTEHVMTRGSKKGSQLVQHDTPTARLATWLSPTNQTPPHKWVRKKPGLETYQALGRLSRPTCLN